MKTNPKNSLLFLLLFTFLFTRAQVPVFSSYPASQNVVLLDFDGHMVEGTSWNGSGPIACNAAGFTATQITNIFNRVAEDYRPFTVNITTDSTLYQSAPATHRMRVVFTTSSSWYGAAGGVAYINSFTWGDNTPCFVFTALLNNNIKYIAEAASHEIGHTLGLRHQSLYDAQCSKVLEYHSGFGGGEIGWAPIMGVGYYRNLTLWHYGSNPFGCNDFQDDLSIITGNGNGVSYRTDDYGNTITTATTASFVNNMFSVQGIIEQPGDVDAVKFTMNVPGRFVLDASPYAVATGNVGSDIDIQVELLSDSGGVIGVYDNPVALNALLDTALAAGTYYLRVQGIGNAYAPNYASLGSYTLFATLTPGYTLPVHALQLKGTTDGKGHKLDWEIRADEKIVQQTLEVAADGTGYKTLSTVDAPGKSYTYAPSTNGILYYRLNVTFDNGRRSYSNTVALRNSEGQNKPILIGNVSNGSLTVSSPLAGSYVIVDMAGRTLMKGHLSQGLNVLSTPLAAAGVYLIRFENSAGRWSEKFSRR